MQPGTMLGSVEKGKKIGKRLSEKTGDQRKLRGGLGRRKGWCPFPFPSPPLG